MIKIEVVCITQQKQIVIPCIVAENSTVEEVILQSKILEHFPEIKLQQQKVGIFNKIVALTQQVADKDRIEIYWPLKIDPKEARKIRAQERKQ